MAVSKRVRYEVLRRDSHSCRYCGGAAPDVVLTVDHVIPVALGGGDDPSNLVAACKDCNAGKTSTSPDGPLVAEVSATALTWSRAMQQAAEERAADFAKSRRVMTQFTDIWESWTWTDRDGEGCPFPLPPDFGHSVRQFLAAGLTFDDFKELTDVAMGSRISRDDKWKYFCGCCWKRVRQSQERAAQILAAEQAPEKKVHTEILGVADYDVMDLWLIVAQEWRHSGRGELPFCACGSDDYCGRRACMLKATVIAARDLVAVWLEDDPEDVDEPEEVGDDA